MGQGTAAVLIRELQQGHDDAALLERFLDCRDPTAFELLVVRHGPMVRRVCQREFVNESDVDDAFQATFLLLVRKAGEIRNPRALGGWLCRVARRVAQRARMKSQREESRDDLSPLAPLHDPDQSFVREVIDEEIGRLPQKYRLAVEMHYVAGHSTEETARQLGCPRGTVLSRLDFARKRLKQRLVLRGVTLNAGALALALAQPLEAVPAPLVRLTVSAAGGGSMPVPALSLVKGVERAMWMSKLKLGAVCLVVVTLLGVGLGRWSAESLNAEPRKPKGDAAWSEEASSVAPDTAPVTIAPQPAKPLGTWTREIANVYKFTIRCTEDRLYGTYEISAEGQRITIEMDADYSVNQEGVLYGVVTGIDVPITALEQDGGDIEGLLSLNAMGEIPFCFRYRIDGDTLTVKNLHALQMGYAFDSGNEMSELILIMGRYTKQAE